ncbi:MAG: response regulator [Pseudomonadota bacterium]|nr:response regulator [Pseudomonadota bacterium]
MRDSRLLIVDDEEHISSALRDYFTILGYVVDVADSKSAAHAMLDRIGYAAVITDLRLSDAGCMEGLEVIRHARVRRPQGARIVLTAFGDPDCRAEAERSGADAFLQKPSPLHELEKVLAGLRNAGAR